MLFTLEALDALHGDSLILHYGEKSNPKFIIIDGGPPTVYDKVLKPRLEQIKSRWQPDNSLPLEMLMVSHIDRDHVYGLLRLAKDLLKQKKEDKTLTLDILTLWHNGFDDIIGNDEYGLIEALVSQIVFPDESIVVPASNENLDSQLVMASVREARDLRNYANDLDIPINTGFSSLVMAPKSGKKVLNMGTGLKFTVVGPHAQHIAELQEDWDDEIKKLREKGKLQGSDAQAIAAKYVDRTAENLSSIVVLAEFENKRILLTGDARGDFIQEGLQIAGLLSNGKIHIDLLKIPHHGSIRNFDRDFFENITADHYVISANGEYGNPDNDTLKLLSEVRGNAEFTLHLTNRKGKGNLGTRLKKFFAAEKKKGKKYKVVFRKENALSLKANLLNPVTY